MKSAKKASASKLKDLKPRKNPKGGDGTTTTTTTKEQTLNIGSGSSGAGAGKITFNPFSITR